MNSDLHCPGELLEAVPVVALLLPPGLERDKFDNKTVSFEEHIKLEHNMWNYLYFIVLVRVKNKTDYTGPESYVAQMIKVSERGERARLTRLIHTWKEAQHLLALD